MVDEGSSGSGVWVRQRASNNSSSGRVFVFPQALLHAPAAASSYAAASWALRLFFLARHHRPSRADPLLLFCCHPLAVRLLFVCVGYPRIVESLSCSSSLAYYLLYFPFAMSSSDEDQAASPREHRPTKAELKAQARAAKKERKAAHTDEGDDNAEWLKFEKEKKVAQKTKARTADDDDEEAHGKKAKAHKKVVHADEPKKTKRSKPSQPLPPFKFFEMEHHGKSNEEVGELWAALSADDKERYKLKAQEDKARYKAEMEEFRAQQEVAEKAKAGKKSRSGW